MQLLHQCDCTAFLYKVRCNFKLCTLVELDVILLVKLSGTCYMPNAMCKGICSLHKRVGEITKARHTGLKISANDAPDTTHLLVR